MVTIGKFAPDKTVYRIRILYCREVSETYTGSFPSVRIQSDCRCSASKPRIHPQTTTMCINNSLVVNSLDRGDTKRTKMNNSSDSWRLDINSHPLEYVNDGDIGTFWVSTALQQTSLTVMFGDIFQVLAALFYVPKLFNTFRLQSGRKK